MATGTATRLIRVFRTPGKGTFIGILTKGEPVQIVRVVILAGAGDRFLEVDTKHGRGFVKEQFVRLDETSPTVPQDETEPEQAQPEASKPTEPDKPQVAKPSVSRPAKPKPAASKVPPEATEKDISVDAKGNVFGPGKIRFGKLHKLGLFEVGTTSIADFIKANPDEFKNLPPSLPRVMVAVSANEGQLEAVNTWDAAFLSWGVYQWTAGQEGDPGELAPLLLRLKDSDPGTFETYFGQYKLDAKAKAPGAGVTPTGTLSLDGETLDTAKRKGKLRTHLWAYRFWRAAHDDTVRKAQVDQAIARIDIFYRVPRKALGGRAISDFITSEVGVTHLLDQHVNRPGHVPDTLVKAIEKHIKKTGRSDPAKWNDGDEAAVLRIYLDERAGTSMTDSKNRAKRIDDAADRGELSRKRGSFH